MLNSENLNGSAAHTNGASSACYSAALLSDFERSDLDAI